MRSLPSFWLIVAAFVLAQADAMPRAVLDQHGLHVLPGNRALLGEWRGTRIAAARKGGVDAGGHPGRAVGAAADHDSVGAGGLERGLRGLRIDDVQLRRTATLIA